MSSLAPPTRLALPIPPPTPHPTSNTTSNHFEHQAKLCFLELIDQQNETINEWLGYVANARHLISKYQGAIYLALADMEVTDTVVSVKAPEEEKAEEEVEAEQYDDHHRES